MTLDPDGVARALARMAGGATLPLANLERLSGGANMESWSFDWGGKGYVLRRAPSAEMMASPPFGHAVEAALVRAARAAGVLAPKVVGELAPDDMLGSGYVMKRVEAEVSPARILAAPPPSLIDDIARELAAIHRIKSSPERVAGWTAPGSPSQVRGTGRPATGGSRSETEGSGSNSHQVRPAPSTGFAGSPPRSGEEFWSLIPIMDTAEALEALATRFADYGGDRPIIALAIKWCRDHLPEPAPPVLVHGDFRMGNLMVDANGLAAVLDWELAHWGDCHEDLAWGCVGAWRFGHADLTAFGCADLDRYFASYEAASGTTVDRTRFRFWLIYRTLWWALGCLQMGDIWRSGADASLERAVIARRTSENELELLLLLEEDAPETQALRFRADPPTMTTPTGEPSNAELIAAIAGWIEADVKPAAQGRERFLVAVALNALGMLRRDTESAADPHDKALADDILAGRQTLATPGLLTRLRKSALAKLTNDVPKYATLKNARAKWIADGEQ